jgi:hypothetical protein
VNGDARRHSPAAERNRGPILAELQRLLPARGLLLEIGSGTGQHAAHCAPALPGWQWQPSDREASARASIAIWCAGLPDVLPALPLDVMEDPWPGAPARVDAVYCANMIHAAPWPVCAALVRGAARHLTAQGLLLMYGPFIEDDVPTAPGNLSFDADLRQRDPAWGLRRLADVLTQARAVGLRLRERIVMPSNNLLLVLERTAQPPA